MRLNASLLFHEMNRYFQVDYMDARVNNLVRTPMFFNNFFRMDEHIVLVSSDHLQECLNRVNHAIIICIDRPERIPEEAIGTNNLIVLNDPMSQNMAFNILNHILDLFNEWEHRMNDILYHSRSFQDMIDLTSEIIGLPISLSDAHFRYIAFSKDSGPYIDEFVTEQNELPLETVLLLQKDPAFHELENIQESFIHTGVERCVHKNIFDKGSYVGRLGVIIRNDTDDVEFCKAIFEAAAPYIEALYAQYNSFTNLNMVYHQLHSYMHQIFSHNPVDRESFLHLMKNLGNTEEDNWRVLVMAPMESAHSIFNISYLCDQMEHDFDGCYCISQDSQIIILQNENHYLRNRDQAKHENFRRYIREMRFTGGCSRIFHSLTTFDILFHAYEQATFAMQQGNPIPEAGNISPFDDYALDYLLLNGSRGISYRQICHPALLTLSEHDRNHATSYIHTLHVYMQNNMNAVATARSLFIHRSSFINRMERISQLVELKLEDPEERLYITMSLRLYLDQLLPESQ